MDSRRDTRKPAAMADNNYDDRGAILLTGATGFLGMELLARFLERTEKTLFALIRGADEDEADARLMQAARAVVPDPERYRDRLVAVRGDVTLPDLGLSDERRTSLAERVDEIVHSAASVAFNLPLDRARDINVDGTRRMLELAAACQERGGLRRFSHISTAYVAGSHQGEFGEDDYDVGQSFRNTYEQSKWEAEGLVREHRQRGLPVTILRPSIVVGEEETGWTPAFNVIYAPLRAYSKGAYFALPARRSSPADVVPASYVADAVLELSQREFAEGHTYNLAAGPRAHSVGELMDMAADAFGRKRALALPPWLYRRVVHPLLIRKSSGKRRRMLERSEIYFPYFSLEVSYDTSRAESHLAEAGIRVPHLRDYFHRLVTFAVATDWGKRPLSRVDVSRSERGVPVPA
jgi:thioester reductase-like protein